MSPWILQHFLNPSFFWLGMSLVAAPIIIHLINRLRYKRVRFAAMDFLLASQKRNQRRVLIEQLLLLLLRILLILAIVALIARLIIDPSQLSLFQGAKTHHIVLLDDTLSMRQRTGESTVFDTGKRVVQRLVAEGADSPQSQVFTLIRVSNPETTLSGLTEVDLNKNLLVELSERLQLINCTHQSAKPSHALEAVLDRISGDRSAARHVHVISDFRKSDWIEDKSAIAALQALEAAEMHVHLIRCTGDAAENLTVSNLGGKISVAAAGVPVSLEATVHNWGTRNATDLRADVFIDGTRLPRTIDFQSVAAGEDATRRFDVVFDSAEYHAVELRIRDDALDADNRRFLAVNVPVENPVLIIDGSPATEQAFYVSDALAADKSVTGFATSVQTPDDLRKTPLENYDLIYLINVPELTPDAIAALEDYVSGGGGLVWYMGDAVRPAFYNETLFAADETLFPVRIALAPVHFKRDDLAVSTSPDWNPGEDPLFELLTNPQAPILDLIFVNVAYPLATNDAIRPNIANDVAILAELSNGSPLFLEHSYGAGKIVTCLTSAGPLMSPDGIVWTNWANGPASFSFAVFQLELAKRIVRSDRSALELLTGQEIDLKLNQAYYQSVIEVSSPDDRIDRIQATLNNRDADATQFEVQYADTDQPGVYQIGLVTQEDVREKRLVTANISPAEGALALMDEQQFRNEIGLDSKIEIHPADSLDWIRNESVGSEVRWFLLIVIALLCIAEQFLASRLSYVV